jgi:YidC/Oxa1 family membrane protein insertase
MPVFLALFRVMRDPYKHIPKGSDLYAAFCTGPKGHLYMDACSRPKLGLPNPQYFLGMNLSEHATAVAGGFLDALPYFILVGLVVITGFLQARQSRRNAPNMNSQMAIITSVLPIGFGLFSLQFPAGLVLYFLVSNLWRLGQQELIMRKITRPGQAAIAASSTKDKDAIDVSEVDTSAFPRAKSGLRKLFQIPGAADGDDTSASGDGGANGSSKPKTEGTAKSNAKSAPAKGAPTKGAATPSKSGAGSSSSSSSGARRRNNKKRKRR